MTSRPLGQLLSRWPCHNRLQKYKNMNTNTSLPMDARARASHSILELPPVEPWPEPVDGARLLDERAAFSIATSSCPNAAPKRWPCVRSTPTPPSLFCVSRRERSTFAA